MQLCSVWSRPFYVFKAILYERDNYLIPLISHGGSQLGIQLAQIFCHCPGSLPAFHGFDLQRINEPIG